eukprot:TRINITY_DN33842_c0_g1_i1.p1 TRINITY_DN33842_c0_g1~~TRINITY_DN33842_c0_g1_i1.p1  ORF type:complete len:126 (+),score=1.18 TRINITY_DN33842_c0_g1_i1:388-765(+)
MVRIFVCEKKRKYLYQNQAGGLRALQSKQSWLLLDRSRLKKKKKKKKKKRLYLHFNTLLLLSSIDVTKKNEFFIFSPSTLKHSLHIPHTVNSHFIVRYRIPSLLTPPPKVSISLLHVLEGGGGKQ